MNGGKIMRPMYLSIRQEATGKRIKELLRDNGYSVKDIQEVMGFENPQAVYKWLSGKSLPSLDNLNRLHNFFQGDKIFVKFNTM